MERVLVHFYCMLCCTLLSQGPLLLVGSESAEPCGNKVVTVPIDESWLYREQPPDGWHIPIYGISSNTDIAITLDDAVQTGENIGAKKMCWKFRATANDATLPISPIYCNYDDVALQQCTQYKMLENPFFRKFPRHIKQVFVMSDNSTYAAVVQCFYGTAQGFIILSKTKEGPQEPLKTQIIKYLEQIGAKKGPLTSFGKVYEKVVLNECEGTDDSDIAASVSSLFGKLHE